MTNISLRSYVIGISWFTLSLISSTANDIIAKYVGLRLPTIEVTFFRLFFGALSLLPFILYYGKQTLITSNPLVHCARGVLLFFAMTSWTYGLTVAPITTATVISFSIPLFVLVFGVFFLKENIIWQRWVAVIAGFVGLVIIFTPENAAFNPFSLLFIAAAVAFAILDIINKRFVIKESMISMLFYSAAITSILALPLAVIYWKTPTLYELTLLFILGASGNLLLFFILKAFSIVDVTATTPYRYLELIFSAGASYLIFNEVINKNTMYSALVIIPATLFVIYSESKNIKKGNSV
jgi:S-adenosylmethionine uptake transporter